MTISRVLGAQFVNRLVGVARKEAKGASLGDGLFVGARALSTGVGNLVSARSLVSTSRSVLSEIGGRLEEVRDLASKASNSNTGILERRELDGEFKEKMAEIAEIIDNSETGKDKNLDLLNVEDIRAVLTNFGLDSQTSDALESAFDKFRAPEGELVDEELESDVPVRLPNGVTKGREYENLFADEASIATRGGAYEVVNDLDALLEQIETNKEGLGSVTEVIEDNLTLIRGVGFSLLDLSDNLDSFDDARSIAAKLTRMVRKEVPAGVMSEINNINPILASSLLFDDA